MNGHAVHSIPCVSSDSYAKKLDLHKWITKHRINNINRCPMKWTRSDDFIFCLLILFFLSATLYRFFREVKFYFTAPWISHSSKWEKVAGKGDGERVHRCGAFYSCFVLKPCEMPNTINKLIRFVRIETKPLFTLSEALVPFITSEATNRWNLLPLTEDVYSTFYLRRGSLRFIFHRTAHWLGTLNSVMWLMIERFTIYARNSLFLRLFASFKIISSDQHRVEFVKFPLKLDENWAGVKSSTIRSYKSLVKHQLLLSSKKKFKWNGWCIRDGIIV